MIGMTLQVDLYGVTCAWQYCMGDTFCYHSHFIMDTDLRSIKANS